MSYPSFDLIGVGNPIMDLLAQVPESFLTTHVTGDKGGMVLVDDQDIIQLIAQLGGTGLAIAPGGSAANTVVGALMLGVRTAFVGRVKDGKITRIDEYMDSGKFGEWAGISQSKAKPSFGPKGDST